MAQPESWGQGYATELVRETLTFAFYDLNADRVIGLVRPVNAASRRILEKCGFRFEREMIMPHGATDQYVCDRQLNILTASAKEFPGRYPVAGLLQKRTSPNSAGGIASCRQQSLFAISGQRIPNDRVIAGKFGNVGGQSVEDRIGRRQRTGIFGLNEGLVGGQCFGVGLVYDGEDG